MRGVTAQLECLLDDVVIGAIDAVCDVAQRIIGKLKDGAAAQAMTDLAERGALGVRELQPTFQLGLQNGFRRPRYSIRASSSWSSVPVT